MLSVSASNEHSIDDDDVDLRVVCVDFWIKIWILKRTHAHHILHNLSCRSDGLPREARRSQFTSTRLINRSASILSENDVTLSNEFASYYYTVRHNNKLKKPIDPFAIKQKYKEAKETKTWICITIARKLIYPSISIGCCWRGIQIITLSRGQGLTKGFDCKI